MAVTESFLVNTNSFDSIIEALIEMDETPEIVSDEFFISMGFESPSDLLVIHMLKELQMLTVDGEPTELYEKLTNPDTTDEAIARGIIHAYTDLFEKNQSLHTLPKDEVHQALDSYFEGRKTDLIIKYMTNTFHKLVTYAGLNNVQKAVDEYFDAQESTDSAPAEEPFSSENTTVEENEDPFLEEDTEVVSEDEDDITSEDNEEYEDEEDSDFDALFLDEDPDESEEMLEDPESPDEASEDRTNGSINFDELPQIRREEKGSKNIDEILDKETEEKYEENLTTETISGESDEEASDDELAEDDADEKPSSSKNQESLEKELLEIDVESTNGFNKNGVQTKENPMANLTNVPTNEKIEKALVKKAELLYKLERFEEVLPAYEDVISNFDDSGKEHLKNAVANAVINRVTVLNKLNRDDDDILTALDEIINRFKDSSTTEYYEQASMAMLQKSQLLEDDSHEVLLPLFEAIIARLRNASNPKIKTQVDDIFVNRVDILTETGPEHELLDAVDDLIERFKDSQVHTGQLEQAMYKKAEILEGLNRDEEALEAYSEFLDKFGKTTELV